MARWPAVVLSYDAEARQCEVLIPRIAEGGLIAEIEQNLGDRSEHTEIRIKKGDRVWVDFMANDTRFPIITGFRAKNVGNMIGTRHWEHENFTFIADQTVLIKAGQSIRLEAGALIELVVGGTILKLDTATIAQVATQLTIKGPVTQTGGDLTSDGISLQHHLTPTAPPGPVSEPQ